MIHWNDDDHNCGSIHQLALPDMVYFGDLRYLSVIVAVFLCNNIARDSYFMDTDNSDHVVGNLICSFFDEWRLDAHCLLVSIQRIKLDS